MFYTNTPEQTAVINWQRLVVNAFAGTGKITLVLYAEANPARKMLHLVCNRVILHLVIDGLKLRLAEEQQRAESGERLCLTD